MNKESELEKELVDLKLKSKLIAEDLEKKAKGLVSIIKEKMDITLPGGFDVSFKSTERYSLNENVKFGLNISIEEVKDENSKKGKYFWINDSSVNLEFDNNKLISYDCNNIEGGQNRTEYGDKDQKEIDPIQMAKIKLIINKSYIRIMQAVKLNPEIILTPLVDYSKTNAAYQNAVEKNREKRKEIDQVSLIEKSIVIDEVFKNISKSTIEKLFNNLKSSASYETELPFVSFERSNNNGYYRAEDITLKCKSGDRVSYGVKFGNDKYVGIKASEVEGYLSKMLIIDGNTPKKITDLQKILEAINPEFSENDMLGKSYRSAGVNLQVEKLSDLSIKIKELTSSENLNIIKSTLKNGI